MTGITSKRLGALLQLSDSGTWGEPASIENRYPVLRSSNVVNNALDFAEVAHRAIPSAHSQAKKLAEGDIIVVTSSGSSDHIGKCGVFSEGLSKEPCYFSNFMLRLRPDRHQVDPLWLYYWLTSRRGRNILEKMNPTTSGLRNLKKGLYLAQSIPLRPMREQQRFVAMLNRVDAIRRGQREIPLLLEEVVRSVFLEMFGNPVRNDKGWALRSAASCVHRIETGTSVKGDGELTSPDKWAVLKISAVTSGRYLPTECKSVGNPPAKLIVPRQGDLLFSRANTRELVAATCLVDHDAERLFLPDKLWRITPNAELATAEYIRFLFADPGFRQTLTRHATGTSGSMLNISQQKLLRLRLPMPPVALQQQFAEIVWIAYKLRARVRGAILHTDEMFESFTRAAFEKGA